MIFLKSFFLILFRNTVKQQWLHCFRWLLPPWCLKTQTIAQESWLHFRFIQKLSQNKTFLAQKSHYWCGFNSKLAIKKRIISFFTEKHIQKPLLFLFIIYIFCETINTEYKPKCLKNKPNKQKHLNRFGFRQTCPTSQRASFAAAWSLGT